MNNLDIISEKRVGILNKLNDAISANDKKAYGEAMAELCAEIEESVREDYTAVQVSNDSAIKAQRGIRQLTSDERTFWQKFIDERKSNIKQGISNANYILPDTIIDAIFDDLRAAHPLLNLVRFRNTGALTKIIVSTTSGSAGWGGLGSTITDEISASFAEIDLTAGQLTAFIPVPRYVLEFGPEWVDRYVRECLTEAIAVKLEDGIVDGTGKNQPIGMGRKLSGAVDGVYPRKDASVTLTELDPAAFGTILGALSVDSASRNRAVTSLIMVVNPADYYGKVFSGATVRTADGTYRSDVLPYPCTVVVSAAVPANKAIFGMANRYFFALGSGSRDGRIEYSDEYKFLELQRYYAVVLYGNGRALDENDFVVADITNLTPTVQHVVVDGTVTTTTEG